MHIQVIKLQFILFLCKWLHTVYTFYTSSLIWKDILDIIPYHYIKNFVILFVPSFYSILWAIGNLTWSLNVLYSSVLCPQHTSFPYPIFVIQGGLCFCLASNTALPSSPEFKLHRHLTLASTLNSHNIKLRRDPYEFHGSHFKKVKDNNSQPFTQGRRNNKPKEYDSVVGYITLFPILCNKIQ